MSKEDRRRRIVTIAIDMIGERGFRAFSVKDLASRCEMTDAGVLHHFGSKAGLLTAVLDERDRQDLTSIAETLGESTEVRPHSLEELRTILAAIVARNRTRPEFIRLFAMLRVEALAQDHPAHDYFARRDREARRMYEAMLPLDLPDRSSLARQLIVAIDGLELQWLRDEQAFDLVAEWEKLCGKLLPVSEDQRIQASGKSAGKALGERSRSAPLSL